MTRRKQRGSWTPAKFSSAVSLYEQGFSYRIIAAAVGLSISTVHRMLTLGGNQLRPYLGLNFSPNDLQRVKVAQAKRAAVLEALKSHSMPTDLSLGYAEQRAELEQELATV